MSLLGKLFGHKDGNKISSFPTPSEIRTRWKRAENSFTGKILSYMPRVQKYCETGHDAGILKDLANWRSQSSNSYAVVSWFRRDGWVSKVAHEIKSNPEQLARFAWVIASASQGGYSRKNQRAVPVSVTALAETIWMKDGYVPSAEDIQCFKQTLNILDASYVDLLEAVLVNSGVYTMINRINLKYQALAMIAGEDDKLIELAGRVDAEAKHRILKTLEQAGMSADVVYYDCIKEMAVSNSAKLRERAIDILANQHEKQILPDAIDGLNARKKLHRETMIRILGQIGGEIALDALVGAREGETISANQQLIDQFLNVANDDADDKSGFRDIHDNFVELPARIPLTEGRYEFTEKDMEELADIDRNATEASLKRRKEQIEAHRKLGQKIPRYLNNEPQKIDRGAKLWKMIETPLRERKAEKLTMYWRDKDDTESWVVGKLDQMGTAQALELLFDRLDFAMHYTSSYYSSSIFDWFWGKLEANAIDFRTAMERAESSFDYIVETTRQQNPHYMRYRPSPFAIIDNSLYDVAWPYVYERIEKVRELLPPKAQAIRDHQYGIRRLKMMPSVPKSMIEPLIGCATSPSAVSRKAAWPLVVQIPGFEGRLVELFTDRRQQVRANVAQILGDIGAKAAIKPIEKVLKKEKSEVARAAMIVALKKLGADTSAYLSPTELAKEATKINAKIKRDKLDWLNLDTLPEICWKDGKPVDRDIIDGWLRLAMKLKDPREGALFNLYFDELRDGDAERLSNWVLQSWIAYDTETPNRADYIEAATETANERMKQRAYSYYKDWTLQDHITYILSYSMPTYVNSGSDTKGILALTHHANSSLFQSQLSSYLKNHGKRVATSKSILDLLSAVGSPEALQILVATSTRFKQRTVREHAEVLVNKIAEEREWTSDELADRSVPTGGFDEEGKMELPVGEEEKLYLATLGDDFSITIQNPDGKVVKALSSGKDENTRNSKKLLSEAKKMIKSTVVLQTNRLYEAMLSERSWSYSDWTRDFAQHPIMLNLMCNLIWFAKTGENEVLCRPSLDGTFLNSEGSDVDLSPETLLSLAHGSRISPIERENWQTHIADFELNSVFDQLSRQAFELTPELQDETQIVDRRGWIMENFKLRSLAGKFTYQRGQAEDGGVFVEYFKEFNSAGVRVSIEFTGSYLPEENIPIALVSLSFEKQSKRARGSSKFKLKEVPPLVLSEAWHDWIAISKGGAFDKDWQKKGLW